MNAFQLGSRSLANLDGVHGALVAVVKRAIEVTTQDFSVTDGVRTLEEQKKLKAKGVTTTLNSRHLTGHAVDLVPYIDGRNVWEWDPIYDVVLAVRFAATEMAIPIVWGGGWHLTLNDWNESPEKLKDDYIKVRRRQGRKPFLDGPHYELPRNDYPDTSG